MFNYLAVLNHPETIKKITRTSEPKNRFTVGAAYKLVVDWLGRPIVMSSPCGNSRSVWSIEICFVIFNV